MELLTCSTCDNFKPHPELTPYPVQGVKEPRMVQRGDCPTEVDGVWTVSATYMGCKRHTSLKQEKGA